MSMTRVHQTAGRFGLHAAVADIAFRVARKLTDLTILKGVVLTVDTIDSKFLGDDAGYRWGFLDAAALHEALRRGAPLSLDPTFVDEALARGDLCYAAADAAGIASYGWYSSRPTAVTAIADDMVLHFDRSYSYMYRGYTLPAHRGKRLHGIGMARAMDSLVKSGSRGLVSVVEATNTASLTSCYRLGYHDFGEIYAARIAGRFVTYATRGCAAYAFRLKQGLPAA